MARLVYSVICSVDGYTHDADGTFDWAAPDAEVHAVVNEQQRPIGTYLYGRRMYETMRVWQDQPSSSDDPAAADEASDFADLWRAADKAVFSTTLAEVTTPRTSLHRTVDPDAITAMKELAGADLSIGGPTLAAQLLRAGLVDEFVQYVVPVVVGGGTRALPDDMRLDLELREQRRFANGTVFLRYDIR